LPNLITKYLSMTTKQFHYGKYLYEYTEIKEKRKTLSLIVNPNMLIILKIPKDISQQKIDSFLKRKWSWLEKQLQYFKKYQAIKYKKEYISGENFLYLGRQYKLIVKQGKQPCVKLSKGIIQITTTKSVTNGSNNKKLLNKWYESRIEKKFNERYKIVLKNFNYNFTPKLIVRKMSKRWGSYLTGKKIILNPELIKASTKAIDYVITHELCHMQIKQHDKNFYKLLDSKYPNWQVVKEKLELRLG